MMTKEGILQAAIAMLYQKGILHFSLNEFLQSNHISKGSFYHFFKDKDSLMYEALCKDNQSYRYKIEKELYACKNLEEKLYKVFEVYCVDSAHNRQLCKMYEDMFVYAIASQNTLFARYLENVKEHTHYLILQSIETAHIGRVRQAKMRDLSPMLSFGLDGFWLMLGVIGKTWEERKAEIEGFIKALCVIVTPQKTNMKGVL